MPYEILLQHVSIVPCLCVFGISHFGLYYLYSSTNYSINTLKKIEQAVDIMKKNNVDLVDIKPFEKYSFNECSGWGNCFENNKLSKFI